MPNSLLVLLFKSIRESAIRGRISVDGELHYIAVFLHIIRPLEIEAHRLLCVGKSKHRAWNGYFMSILPISEPPSPY